MRRICCPLECGSLQVVTATRYTRSSINRFIDRARVGDAGRRARNRRHTRVGEGGLELVLGVGLGLGEILVMGLGLGEILAMVLPSQKRSWSRSRAACLARACKDRKQTF